MLQVANLPSQSARAPPPDISAAATLMAMRATARRQWPIAISVLLSALALAAAYLVIAQPKYTATAELYVDARRAPMLQQQQTLGVDTPVDASLIDSQVEILKSEKIAEAVIKDLRLLDQPEFSDPAAGPVGATLALARQFLLGATPPRSDYEIRREATARFARALTVKRLGLSYVVEIDFQSLDPARAARIANAVAEAYVVDSLEAKYRSSRRAAGWLQDRLKELRAQTSAAERAVVDYRADNNIVNAGGRLLNEQQLAELNSALTAAQAARSEAEARAQRVEEILQAVDDKGISAETATVTDTLRNDVITRLRQQYLDLAERQSDWAQRYGANHQAVANLRNQMQEIRRSIVDELKRIAETYRSDLDIARAHEDSIKQDLAGLVAQSNQTSQAQVALHELDANAQSYRALTDNFLQLYMASVQQQSFPVTESRLITEASAPLRPSSPNPLLAIAIALIGGGAVAFAVATWRDLDDRVVRTGAQLEAVLGLECVATAPFVRAANAAPAWTGDPQTRTFGAGDGIFAYALEAPLSPYAESLRAIKMAIDLRALDRPNKVIGLTSSLPGEGKSTLAVALARLIADSGGRVILVDGDLRNPGLSRTLAPSAQAGVAEAIRGRAMFDDLVWRDAATSLAFLPATNLGRRELAADLLASAQAEALFRELRNSYDYVIADLSPLAPIVDARGTSRFVDSYLFVVEWSRTRLDVAEQALGTASRIRGEIMGAVLNKVRMRTMRRYASHSGCCDEQYLKRYSSVG